MQQIGGSLGELRQAVATRRLLKAQRETLEALDEVKTTSRVLHERIGAARVHGLVRHSFAANRMSSRLPRAAPFGV